MKVLQVTAHHWLYSMGGTELYVKDLVRVLKERDMGVPVLTFQGQGRLDGSSASESFETLPLIEHQGLAAFKARVSEYLDECRPTLAHFHSLHQEEVVVAEGLQKRRIPYLLTYHQPGTSCPLGTLLRWGSLACDGKVEVLKCASCRIHNRTRLPRVLCTGAAMANKPVSPLLGRATWSRLAGKIDYWGSTEAFARRLEGFLRHCEMVLACSEWSVDVFRRNGVEAKRIVVVPQGLPLAFEAAQGHEPGRRRPTTNVGYVGRISPEKGLERLIRAVRLTRSPHIRLLVAGGDPQPGQPLESKLRAQCAGDERIRFLGTVSPGQMHEVYAQLDYLAVPSVWFETGPLVVWEALAHRVPILASARMGHPSLLENGRGLIVEPHTPERWAEVLTQAAEGSLGLRVGRVPDIRSMRAAAEESAALYASAAAAHGARRDPGPRAGDGTAGDGTRPPALLAVPTYLGTLAAVRALGRAGLTVHVAAGSRLAPANWSRLASRVYRCPSPHIEPERFLEWLLELGASAPGQVLLPTCDELAWLYARHRVDLETHFRLDVPAPGVAHALLNKWRLHLACEAAGVDSPKTVLPEEDADLSAAARDVGFPLLVKPQTQAFLHLHHKGVVVESPADLERRYAEFRASLRYAPLVLADDPDIGRPVLQRFVKGAAESIYNLSGYIDKSGEVFIRQASVKLLQQPRRVGVGLCFEEADVDTDLAARLAALCRHLGYHGVFEAEYLTSGGRQLLIDFNPRFYGQMGFEVARGVNVPLLAYLSATGDEARLHTEVERAREAMRTRQKRVYCAALQMVAYLPQLWLTRRLSTREVWRWCKWMTAHGEGMSCAVLDRDDPLPALIHGVELASNVLIHPRATWRQARDG